MRTTTATLVTLPSNVTEIVTDFIKDGSYYYRNGDNSSYYNSVNGSSTYTAPNGNVYKK